VFRLRAKWDLRKKNRFLDVAADTSGCISVRSDESSRYSSSDDTLIKGNFG
jgi:hypothetical protein